MNDKELIERMEEAERTIARLQLRIDEITYQLKELQAESDYRNSETLRFYTSEF